MSTYKPRAYQNTDDTVRIDKRQCEFQGFKKNEYDGFKSSDIKDLEFHGNWGPEEGRWYSKACILFWPKSRRQLVSDQRTVLDY